MGLSDSDRSFIDRFERCEMEYACWSHEAHLRMAWIQFARSRSFEEGLSRIREGIQRFNASLSNPGYHETVTVAFARAVWNRRQEGPTRESWEEFRRRIDDMLAKAPPYLHHFYSPELLQSEGARAAFCEPDRRPLPSAGAVRPAQRGDIPALLAIYAPYVRETPVSFETEVPSVEVFTRRWEELSAFAPWLVMEEQGALAGYAYASSHRSRAAYQWTVEVSVYTAPAHRRRGVARTLYRRLFEGLNAQGFRRVLAGIALPNDESRGFHESLGFTPIGVYPQVGFKAGRWHDVGWWQLPLGSGEPPPPPVGPQRWLSESFPSVF